MDPGDSAEPADAAVEAVASTGPLGSDQSALVLGGGAETLCSGGSGLFRLMCRCRIILKTSRVAVEEMQMSPRRKRRWRKRDDGLDSLSEELIRGGGGV